MIIKLRNPAPNPEKRETSVCEIELDTWAYFSLTSDTKNKVMKDEADCIVVKKGSINSEYWPKSAILNWEEL